MSEPTRDMRNSRGGYLRVTANPIAGRSATDADLAAWLRERLGMDVESLREALEVPCRPIEPGSALCYRPDHVQDFIDGVARKLLDILARKLLDILDGGAHR